MTIRDWWNAKSRAVDEQNARKAEAHREQVVTGIRLLRGLSDDELIAQAPARTSLSHPHHEMEMERRLKDSIEALTRETAKARWWAFWGSVAISALTVALVALTVVLALKT